MKEVLDLIMNNLELIAGVLGIVVSLVLVGRKRATQLVLKYLDNTKDDFLKNIDKHAPVFAKYIYAKLPKSARLFLTVKRIEKIIIKFAQKIQTLDNN